MPGDEPFELSTHPVHLGLGARVDRLPPFTGDPSWYQDYGAQVDQRDGAEGRLVSMYTFTEPWPTWEVHPNGEELVVCVAGSMTLQQEIDGEVVTTVVEAGQAVINPAGVWHTADIDGSATAIFVTAGLGTENRDR